jgi:hypothetical protein
MKFVKTLKRYSVEAVELVDKPFRFNASTLQRFNAKEK